MPAKKAAAKKKAPAKKKAGRGSFSAAEKSAMREAVRERKKGSGDGEKDVQKKIAEMPAADRRMAKKIHAIVKSKAPHLTSRTWYGMPAYANADGKVILFFKPASKFKARYAELGFNDAASLDGGNMWPTVFALTKLTAAEEKKIAALVKKAA